jgi:hypothetical protein
MPISKYLGVVLAASLLSGCSAFDGVWSALAGGGPSTASGGRVIAIPTPKPDAALQPAIATGTTAPLPSPSITAAGASAPAPSIIPAGGAVRALPSSPSILPVATTTAAAPTVAAASGGPSAGTPQAQGLRAEVQRLQEDLGRQNTESQRLHQALAQDSASYYGTVATIHSRLQIGTTPGNPEVVAQWNLAQVALDRMSADIARLAVLSGESASDSALATQILDSIKAGGAGAGDQRQLQALESDTRTAQGQVRQLVDAIAQDITRQTAYLDNERTNLVGLLTAIKSGELYGKRLADGRYVAALSRTGVRRDAVLSGSSERKPLVVIRFRQPQVAYEDALYGAVKRALERRPSASFDLVAVAPVATTPAQVDANGRAAKRYAATVLHSLTEMGVPAERVSLSSTTSASVKNDEVQIYVR